MTSRKGKTLSNRTTGSKTVCAQHGGAKWPWIVSRGILLCCRAGELSAKELEELMVIVSNPRTFKIPDWFLNRQKDHKDGRFSQLTSSALDTKLREDLERLKKIR